MTKIRVAINGFGRIGRLAFRILSQRTDMEVVAINDLTNTKTLAHLLKYDSNHGIFKGDVSHDSENVIVNGHPIRIYAQRDPSTLPWGDLKIDVVLESTGIFTDAETANAHLKAGARKVVISAPATGDLKTIVLGVNDASLDGSETIVSNASCTTNCLAPMVKIIDELYGIEHGFMTTIHAYTNDQQIQDAPHKDLRRARAGAYSIIPTSTGAAKAIGLVLPHLKGKLNGNSMRVPIPDGSITDFTVVVKNGTPSVEEINAAFKKASENELKGILEYTEDEIVSIDIVGNSHSCIIDSNLTMVIGNTVKVVGWYDNEFGYSNRAVELMAKIGA